MLNKIKNMHPADKLAAKIVITHIVLPITAAVVTNVVLNKIFKDEETTEN